MANTAVVYARIDPKLKKDVDEILDELEVSPSALIQMLYGQIKLTRSIPFELKLPTKNPVFIDEISREELDNELSKGLKDMENGNVYNADEVQKILFKNTGSKWKNTY